MPRSETPKGFRAILRYAPVTARKAKPMVDLVRGVGVNEALEQLLYVNRRAAPMLAKLIRSAIANATQAGEVDAKNLFVASCCANEGPLKQRRMRYRPGPQGRSLPIRKRTVHLEVVLGVRELKGGGGRRRARAAKPAVAGKAE